LQHVANEPPTGSGDDRADVEGVESFPGPSRLHRSETVKFDTKTDCFTCAKSRKRNEELTPISEGTGEKPEKRL